MKRVRHVAFTAQRGGEQIREDEQQAPPIYNALAQAVHQWDILGLAKYDDLAYEDRRMAPAASSRSPRLPQCRESRIASFCGATRVS